MTKVFVVLEDMGYDSAAALVAIFISEESAEKFAAIRNDRGSGTAFNVEEFTLWD